MTPDDTGAPDYCKRPEWADSTAKLHLLPGDSAARHLADLMANLSDHYRVPHESLWAAAAPGSTVLKPEDSSMLRTLAKTAGGWIAWLDGDGPNLDGGTGPGPRLVAWDGGEREPLTPERFKGLLVEGAECRAAVERVGAASRWLDGEEQEVSR